MNQRQQEEMITIKEILKLSNIETVCEKEAKVMGILNFIIMMSPYNYFYPLMVKTCRYKNSSLCQTTALTEILPP